MSRNQKLKSVPMMKGVYELGLTGWGGSRCAGCGSGGGAEKKRRIG